jgi:hypothetical protein
MQLGGLLEQHSVDVILEEAIVYRTGANYAQSFDWLAVLIESAMMYLSNGIPPRIGVAGLL